MISAQGVPSRCGRGPPFRTLHSRIKEQTYGKTDNAGSDVPRAEIRRSYKRRHINEDLKDTLAANREHCVGMAANMIGIKKRIIIANVGIGDIVMFNPVITKKDSPYETEEGCLSLAGVRKTIRCRNIELEFTDLSWKRQKQKYSGFIAQIIQHECDHLEGIII